MEPINMDWNLIDKALQFATIAHKQDNRKGTDIPYITHPLAVVMITTISIQF